MLLKRWPRGCEPEIGDHATQPPSCWKGGFDWLLNLVFGGVVWFWFRPWNRGPDLTLAELLRRSWECDHPGYMCFVEGLWLYHSRDFYFFISALFGWCGSVGFFKSWPLVHNGVFCSSQRLHSPFKSETMGGSLSRTEELKSWDLVHEWL